MKMTENQRKSTRDVGRWVRKARRERGLTFEDTAEAAGLSLWTLGQIERTGRISLRSARALAPVLGMKVTTLLGL